ncbi:hypothetical protein AU255_03865 [Methyloprofundus sedimenti]|uniref:Acyltransferase 3 domain-containing protein n=1 Tax=Methyloprofundus sedimenti TaxID=1420851 RepID=A0A1V8M642_9GAMM|nr:hypothetical protein AU255_03865 [Methyloprofundus sedimenti]
MIKGNSAIDYYDWVDYAKGIGIIIVVYGHVARGVFNARMIINKVDTIVSLFDLVFDSARRSD